MAEDNKNEYIRLKVDDALELMALIGKNINEVNIPQEAIKYLGEYPFAVYYDTTFRGKSCSTVTLYFNTDYLKKTSTIKGFTICSTNKDFPQCKEYLDNQLGECHTCGMTPYVASNGGAVTYYIYYKDGYCYHLSSASAKNYYSLDIKRGEPQGQPNRQPMGLGLLSPLLVNKSQPTPTPNPTPASGEVWTCPSCGCSTNKGKFCGECGRLRQ